MILLGVIKGPNDTPEPKLPAIPQVSTSENQAAKEEEQDTIQNILNTGNMLYYGVFVAGILIILITWKVLKK